MRIAFVILLIGARVLACGAEIKPYEWQKDRQRYTLSEKEKNLAEYVLKYHRQYDYDWAGNELVLLLTEHRITHVTNSETIQRANRIYVSLNNVLEVVELKARSINKEGKVIFFDQSNLKEIKDEEGGNAYKIFAIEGVEADSELEYFYTLKMKAKGFETSYLQFEMPLKAGSLLLQCPSKLAFELHLYHDSTKVSSDSVGGKNRYSINLENVPGLAKENFSYFDASRKRVEIKLAHNFTRSGARLNTWADAAKSFYKLLTRVDEEGGKALEKFVKTLGDDISWTMDARIRNIEDRIKNSIKVATPASGSGYESVPEVLKFRQASSQGMTHLLVMIFNQLGIQNNIVITCSREVAKFDGRFDSWTYLDEYLIYFPVTKQFLCPSDGELRYPLIPTKYMANKGLFIEPVSVGTLKSALGSIRDIPALAYTSHTDNLRISVEFNKEMEINAITHKRTFTGYEAAYFTMYYSLMTTDQKNKFIEELFRSSIPDVKLTKWSASSSVVDYFPRFDVEANFTTDHFIEKAGAKIFFKAGELIGPQTELYRDDKRMTNVENSSNRGYDRVITITIPEGYKIVNTETLKVEAIYKDGETTPFSFSSQYSIDKSVLTITIQEYYKEIFAPLSRYEDFRKVINAAADFNKRTLVFEKQ